MLRHWIPEDKLILNALYRNPNPSAIPIIEKNMDKKNYFKFLSSNPNAIHILEKNPDKIHWDNLSYNPNAIHLL